MHYIPLHSICPAWNIRRDNRLYFYDCHSLRSFFYHVHECMYVCLLLSAGSSGFRSKGRFPTLCWLSSRTGASICRSSQPLVGLSNSRNSDDEDLIQAIQECCSNEFESHEIYRSAKPPSASMSSNLLLDDILISPTPYESHPQQKTRQRPYVIVDARPLLNAKANQAVGKGVESTKAYGNVSVIFMDIANIHVARKSLDTLEETASDENLWSPCVCDMCDSSLSFPFPLRLRNLEASGWMNHVHKILLAATKIAHCVGTQRLSVLVHCSDGWDRTAQLTSLRFASISGRCRHCLRSLTLLLSVSAACCFLTATTALWRAS